MSKIKLANNPRARRGGVKGGNIPGLSGDGSLVSAVGSLAGAGSWSPPLQQAEGFASAQPGVIAVNHDGSGFVDGAVITISKPTGGLGVKSPAPPLVWAPMDTDINPTSLGRITAWSTQGGESRNLEFNATEGVAGNGCARSGAGNLAGDSLACVRVPGFYFNADGNKSIVARKRKQNFPVNGNFEATYPFDQGGAINWKVVRYWKLNYGYPNLLAYHTWGGGITVEGPATNHVGYFTKSPEGLVNEWYLDEFLVKGSSGVDTTDGEFNYYLDGEYISLPEAKTLMMQPSNYPGYMEMTFPIHFRKENVTFPEHYRCWADDVYVDDSWMRVMVTDSASFGSVGQKREFVIPATWTDTEITAKLHLGWLGTFAGKYLWVTNADNVPTLLGSFT